MNTFHRYRVQFFDLLSVGKYSKLHYLWKSLYLVDILRGFLLILEFIGQL